MKRKRTKRKGPAQPIDHGLAELLYQRLQASGAPEVGVDFAVPGYGVKVQVRMSWDRKVIPVAAPLPT